MSARLELKALYATERDRISALSASARTGDYAHPVFGEGPYTPELMLIGEAPGRDEATAGKPFIGKAGKQLDAMLETADIERAKVFVTNAVKFRPTKVKPASVSNRTPTGQEVKAALSALQAELSILRPQVVATLGNTPLSAVCAICGIPAMTVGAAHGRALQCTLGGAGFTLFPLYHPASGIYNRDLIEIMQKDLIILGELLREEEIL